MNTQQAIRILMLSPCYWLLDLPARKILILEFCASYEQIVLPPDKKKTKQRLLPHRY